MHQPINIVEVREDLDLHLGRKIALVLSIFNVGVSLFFWSNNITGQAISGLHLEQINIIGGSFFILAVIGFWTYTRMLD